MSPLQYVDIVRQLSERSVNPEKQSTIFPAASTQLAPRSSERKENTRTSIRLTDSWNVSLVLDAFKRAVTAAEHSPDRTCAIEIGNHVVQVVRDEGAIAYLERSASVYHDGPDELNMVYAFAQAMQNKNAIAGQKNGTRIAVIGNEEPLDLYNQLQAALKPGE